MPQWWPMGGKTTEDDVADEPADEGDAAPVGESTTATDSPEGRHDGKPTAASAGSSTALDGEAAGMDTEPSEVRAGDAPADTPVGAAAPAAAESVPSSEPDVTRLRGGSRGPIVAVANQKGGVGKTTTAVSLSAALAESGARVVLVDLDPQANASSGLSCRADAEQPTTYHALVGSADAASALVDTPVPNLRVLPSSIDLAGAEIELVSAFSREQRLRKLLEPIRADADIIVVDCPPSLGLLTVNALTAADGVLVPIQCEYYALEGLEALRRNVELVRANLNPELAILGFALTMLDGRTRLSQQVVDEVRLHFGDKVFHTRIPRSVRLAEAPGFGQPITAFDPGSRGAMAYRRLAAEVLARLEASTSVERGT